MTQSSDRRRAELDVIEAARILMAQVELAVAGSPETPSNIELDPLLDAIHDLDALPLDEPTRARAGGPLLTSQNAAAFVDGARAASMAGRILREIDRRCGATTEEVCTALSGKHQTVSARIHELWRNGWLRTAGERETTSGQLASIWRVSPEARAALLEGRRVEIEADWEAMRDG